MKKTLTLLALACTSHLALAQNHSESYFEGVNRSVGMPQRCRDEINKWDNWERMGGKNWDYRVPADHMIMIDDWADD